MLQTQTVERGLFELLKRLMQDKVLVDFYLVGVTALALLYGHRKSIDLDLFTSSDFDTELLKSHLMQHYDYKLYKSSEATLIGHIDNIKVDCIKYNYQMVKPMIEEDGIRMASPEDIAAMKLTAICQSGNRLKDFVDIAFLSEKMTLNDMLTVFAQKFPKTDIMSAVRGLTYFEDTDFSVKIVLTDGVFKWKAVEKRIAQMIKYPDKIFMRLTF